MPRFASAADAQAIQDEVTWDDRDVPSTVYDMLRHTVERFGDRPAVSFQITSDKDDPGETLTWRELGESTTRAANLFRDLGVGPDDAVALILPNATETVVAQIGAMTAGIAAPINPLLDPAQIAALLRETGAKVVVTLKSFPRTDVAQKVATAVADAPGVETVLEVDLTRYLGRPKRWIVPFMRPKTSATHHAKVLGFNDECARRSAELDFSEPEDRLAAYFHTGGTTGMPKLARHRQAGMVYNGWIGQTLLFTEEDVVICPLPLFHVFASHVIVMSMLKSGAHGVFPTPQGYRGDGVFDNFWKLVERYRVSFIITVPTAISALMQRKVDADVSSVKLAFSGSSPLPVELFKRFEKASGVTIIEGYGLTEATCLVSCNPPQGEKKIGSVGVPFPYTDVKILDATPNGVVECDTDVIGEICVASPGVEVGETYTDPEKNRNLYHGNYLRTGDLGRIDDEGYLWITGRAKDLIIRGGHNIDPALIEQALAGHDDVAMVGAIGQPDAHAGELPCVYVELVSGAAADRDDLMAFAREKISERAAVPKYVEILDSLPTTAVGKVFKPDLRRRAIARVFDGALKDAGSPARVSEVTEEKKRGLVAQIAANGADGETVRKTLGQFAVPWAWAD